MRFRFKTKKLRELYEQQKSRQAYPADVVDAFFRVMSVIRSAPDESMFRSLAMLHYEKLKGRRGRAEQRSMILHGRWRLLLTVEVDDEGQVVLILEISQHYEGREP